MQPVPGAEPPMWIGATEVSWDLFDIFVYRLDQPQEHADADASARPSKPYVPPDCGYGHAGYAAIGMTHASAVAFCRWLSDRTGRTYRLPTEEEWERICAAGIGGPGMSIERRAWCEQTSGGVPRELGTSEPDANGVFDLLGNVAEWTDGRDGTPIAKGGCFRDPCDQISPTTGVRQTRSWNQSDPQIPKSKWWLADCDFVGFRVVCGRPAIASESQQPPAEPHSEPDERPVDRKDLDDGQQ